MHEKFRMLVEQLHPKFEALCAAQPVTDGAFRGIAVCERGVYLFSEPGKGPLYVGRSNRIRRRYGLHCRPGARHNTASFAFRIAREQTGRGRASYRPGPDSRTGLVEDPVFAEAFTRAKQRIRAMEFRFVEECDPTLQCLLEVYVATLLEAPYNDFNNH